MPSPKARRAQAPTAAADVVNSPRPTRLKKPSTVTAAAKKTAVGTGSPATAAATAAAVGRPSRIAVPTGGGAALRGGAPDKRKPPRQAAATKPSAKQAPAGLPPPSSRRLLHSPHTRSPPPPSARGKHRLLPDHATRTHSDRASAPKADEAAAAAAARPAAAAAPRKSPVAQMREQFDKLKIQNNEYLKIIARQEDELRRLQEQQSAQQQPATPPPELKRPSSRDPMVDMETAATESDKLREKERQIKEQQAELQRLQQQLACQHASETMLHPTGDKQLGAARAEDKEACRADNAQQLELENDHAVRQLDDPLETSQAEPCRDQHCTLLLQISALNEQLEQQSHAALADKEQLQRAHENEIRKLHADHSKSVAALEQQVNDLKARLAHADARSSGSDASDPGHVEEQLERILKEFEQDEHSHTVQLPDAQQQPPMPTKPKTPKQQKQGWTARYLPTEAVSWPSPQPLSVLRKINVPSRTSSTQRVASADDSSSHGLDAIPNNSTTSIHSPRRSRRSTPDTAGACPRGDESDDEALFRELEQDIRNGKHIDIDSL